MRHLLTGLFFLSLSTLVGCGFIDEDIHLSDEELAMSGGAYGSGIGISGVGRSGGCGCGRYSSRHLRSIHTIGYSNLMSELYLDDTYIYGRTPADDPAPGEGARHQQPEALPETPVESVAAHAEESRREALAEFAR